MIDAIKMLFIDNPDIEEAIKAFYSRDPEYLQLKKDFYDIAREISKMVDFDLYCQFEQGFASYLARSNDIYYLFGLGLRQEVLSALQPKVS